MRLIPLLLVLLLAACGPQQVQIVPTPTPGPRDCTPENLADATLTPAPPLYGVWLYDPRDQTQRPVLQPAEGVRYTEYIQNSNAKGLPGRTMTFNYRLEGDRWYHSADTGEGKLEEVWVRVK